jgi:hypothetical protein
MDNMTISFKLIAIVILVGPRILRLILLLVYQRFIFSVYFTVSRTHDRPILTLRKLLAISLERV